jgi:hypothetical protein
MASPNAALALDLQQSATYQVVPEPFRDAWISTLLQYPPEDIEKPRNGEAFESRPKEELKDAISRRLNRYGLAAGCRFVVTANRLTQKKPSIEFSCKFHGKKKDNKWKLNDTLKRKDPVTGQLISDRQRDRTDHKFDCDCRYSVSLKKDSDGEMSWLGRWIEERHLNNHPLPMNPMYFIEFKRDLEDYRGLEALGRTLRSAKVPYSIARQIMKDRTDVLMSKKEYYNLLNRMICDVEKDETGAILCSLFELEKWEFCLRAEEDDQGQYRKIRQIVFWSAKTRNLARRFCSASVLLVDATFRTNKRGLPLIVAIGISNSGALNVPNSGKSFPVAYSWCPEENAESYEFFFRSLREEIFSEIPDPAVVISDLSAGMTSAYDTLGRDV